MEGVSKNTTLDQEMNIPDWVSASVAVVALGGGLSGMYATMKSSDDVALYRIEQLAVKVRESEEYDGVLTEDIRNIELELNTQKSTMEYLAMGQTRLAQEIGELTKAVKTMNETLIRQGAGNAKKEDY